MIQNSLSNPDANARLVPTMKSPSPFRFLPSRRDPFYIEHCEYPAELPEEPNKNEVAAITPL